MPVLNLDPGADSLISRETDLQRQARIERERDLIAKSLADIEAGLGTEWPAVAEWLNRLDVDENAPPPPPMGRSPAN